MALLHRDRSGTSADDTVSGPGTADRPTWPDTSERQDTDRRDDHVEVVRRNSFGQTIRTVLATVLLVAIVAVAVANTDQVDIDLLFETVDVSLAALVGGAAFVGLLIGVLLGRAGRRH